MIVLDDFVKKINLISIGDYIENGEYFIHSSFKNSMNFFNKKRILTIGNKFIGGGPTNIILDTIAPIRNYSKVIKNDNEILIGDIKILIDEEKIYDSKIKIKDFDIDKFYKNFALFVNFVKILSSNKGLSPLIDKNFIKNESLMYKFLIKIKNGIDKIFKGDLIDGIREIKGVGIGLTPSGDDFIYGLMTGLKIIEIINGIDLSRMRKFIYELAEGENLISNNFLYFASEGLFFEKTKNLIISLFHGDESEILERTRTLLQIGETSGVDFSVGFILTLKEGGEDVCKRFN